MILRNIVRRKARSSLTILGIAMGVATVVFLLSFMSGLEIQFLSITEVGGGDLIVLEKDAADFSISRVRESIATHRIVQIPGVEEVSPVLLCYSKIDDDIFIILGLKINEFILDDVAILEGRSLTEQDHRKCLLGVKSALKHDKRIGDKITILNEEFEIIGIFETNIRFLDYGGILPLREEQELFQEVDFVSFIQIRVEEQTEVNEVKALLAQFPIDVGTGREIAMMQEDFKIITSATSLVSIIAIIFGAIIITNTMVMSIYERTREIGILRALGWKKKSILTMILKETVLVALLGGLIGIGLGIAFIMYVDWLDIVFVVVQVKIEHLFWGVALAVTLGLLGGIYPALRATRMRPIEALGHVE